MTENNMKVMRETLELFTHMNDDGYYDSITVIKNIVEKSKAALTTPPSISEEYAKPRLCKSCSHFKVDGCEICGCTDYDEQVKGESDGCK